MSNKQKRKKIIIVGAGMAGLTAAVYLSRQNYDVTVYEKSPNIGGLVHSYIRDDFVFDSGPRAIGNAGIIKPLLEDLDIDVPLIKSPVSTGIGNSIIHYNTDADIQEYISSLKILFPDSHSEICKISTRVRKYTKLMKTLNKVANPYFKNLFMDWRYLFLELIPWLPSFLFILFQTSVKRDSIENELSKISANASLNDMVSQHFFKGTPQEFVFGYFQNFQDYLYPLGGTGKLPEALYTAARENGTIFKLNTEVISINPINKTIYENNGNNTEYGAEYDALLWAADLNTLYNICKVDKLDAGLLNRFNKKKSVYNNAKTAESVFTVFAAIDKPPQYFSGISHGHFIYTPLSEGLGDINTTRLEELKKKFSTISKNELWDWLEDFCRLNTYEISMPVLKDSALAPVGKTALIVSILFDGELCKLIKSRGWYSEFTKKTVDSMLENIDRSIYPGIKESILFTDYASPVTLNRMFGVKNGAIVGWSMEGDVPAANHLSEIQASVNTPLPGIYQAGQWTYSPSGVPIAVLTGRIAAAKISSKV